MITISKLTNNFYPVEEVGNGIVRCADELPNKIIYTYFMLRSEGEKVPFVLSENVIDDDFAELVLASCGECNAAELEKVGLSKNRYGFTHFLRVPYTYHSELKGRLDLDRPSTTLCIPIFDAEFSGTETPDEFTDLRRNIVATSNWNREIAPKIVFRFENGNTKGGTGDGYVFTKFDKVLKEIKNLVGVSNGFLELINFNGSIIEIVASGSANFRWIPDRDDSRSEQISKDAIQDRLWHFLTH
jgi:hypothetical protein